jgi:hypothetical protein
VFENRVLTNIFGPKTEEVIGEWRKLHNEELYDLCSSPNIIRVITTRRMIWAEHVARVGDRTDAHRVLMRKPEGNRPLERPRRKREDKIKMDLQDVRWIMHWIDLAQDREGGLL